MKYRRALLVTELEADPAPAFAALRRVAPQLEQLVVAARLATRSVAWLFPDAPSDLNQAATGALARLRTSAEKVAPLVEVKAMQVQHTKNAYSCGLGMDGRAYSLRIGWLSRVRTDKRATDATTPEQVARLMEQTAECSNDEGKLKKRSDGLE